AGTARDCCAAKAEHRSPIGVRPFEAGVCSIAARQETGTKQEWPMRSIASAALGTAAGLVLVASVGAANAQTVITSQPAQTVTTETTTRTVRTLPPHAARRQVVTTRTVTQRIVPAPTTVIDRRVAARTYPRP